jgi:hypothetical protein
MADNMLFQKAARLSMNDLVQRGPLLPQFVGGAGRTAQPPAAPPTPAVTSPPPIAIPPAPVTNPFAALPFRSPGDRIKADDFNALAKGLQVIGDAFVLSGTLFGAPFGQAKLLLAAQQYQITRVISVFGAELDTHDDTSLDTRKVIHVVPAALGDKRLMVVVTEAVETRRFTPNLLGLTYREAFERQRAVMGEGTFPSTPITAVSLVSQSLRDAARLLTR